MRLRVGFPSVFLFLLISCVSTEISYKCGQQGNSMSTRIFGGEKIVKSSNTFPWLVALHDRRGDNFFCAGSLISEKHVLSGQLIVSSKLNKQAQVVVDRSL